MAGQQKTPTGFSHRRGLMYSAPESPLRHASVEDYYPYADERYAEDSRSNVQTVRHWNLQPLLK